MLSETFCLSTVVCLFANDVIVFLFDPASPTLLDQARMRLENDSSSQSTLIYQLTDSSLCWCL